MPKFLEPLSTARRICREIQSQHKNQQVAQLVAHHEPISWLVDKQRTGNGWKCIGTDKNRNSRFVFRFLQFPLRQLFRNETLHGGFDEPRGLTTRKLQQSWVLDLIEAQVTSILFDQWRIAERTVVGVEHATVETNLKKKAEELKGFRQMVWSI
jgi:hypothetical protein